MGFCKGSKNILHGFHQDFAQDHEGFGFSDLRLDQNLKP